MEEQVLNYSEETIKTSKKTLITMGIMMPLIMVVTIMVLSSCDGDIDFKKTFFISLGCVVFCTLEVVIVGSLMFKKLRTTKAIIKEDRVERIGGKFTETVKFEEIKKVKIKKDKFGKILLIRITGDKKTYVLNGFENMDLIVKAIKENINDNVVVSEKRYKVDWSNPLVLVLVMSMTAAVILMIIKFGREYFELYNLVFTSVFALWFLIGKPISKNGGKRFRIFEVIISVIMIIATVINLVDRLV